MNEHSDVFPAFRGHNQPPKSFDLLKWTKGHLKTTGDIRDGLLITGGILYIVGYLVWSFNAWLNNLGLLPALDPQYFVAGLVPVLILLVAYLGGKYLKRFALETWPVLVGKEAKGFWWVIRVVLLLSFWTSLALFYFGPVLAILILLFYVGYKIFKLFAPNAWLKLSNKLTDKELKGWHRATLLVLSLLALAVFFVLLIRHRYFTQMIFPGLALSIEDGSFFALFIALTLLPPMEVPLFSLLSRFYRWFWVHVGILLFVLGGMIFYLDRVYPNFPQEFGGVRPRCAYLDLVKSQLSNETLQAIVPNGAIESSQPVVRSLKVEILYSGRDVMLVKSQGRVYEIGKSVTQTINDGCDKRR